MVECCSPVQILSSFSTHSPVENTESCLTNSQSLIRAFGYARRPLLRSRLEARLRAYLPRHNDKSDLLFVNQRGRPFSANKLRAKQLHPLLDALGIPRGGFHSMRHGAASSLLAEGVTPAVVQRQLRHSDARITLGIYGHVVGNQQRDAVEKRSARIAKFAVN
jgi:integrase